MSFVLLSDMWNCTRVLRLFCFDPGGWCYVVLSRYSHQGRAVGVVAGATRAFGRRTQGVWGAGPPTAGRELSGYQALKPPQINIDLTKSLKYESFVLPKLDYF